ncbi:MAG: type II toxin-antitoxin system RelE/ParE family toxin [Firmicutes bacterium]|nr:type II toxin-antitoxin system RelE/ParE family toxin [Bacillota bacterium]
MPKSPVFLKEALEDIDGIYDYIAADSPIAALEVTDRILKHIEQLIEFPKSGKLYPDEKLKDYQFRTLTEPPYLIFYRLIDQTVTIYRVLHGARDILNAVNLFNI